MSSQSPKKVLYLSPNGFLGGAERFVCNLTLGHSRTKNYQIGVLFFREGESYNLCLEQGIKCYLLPIQFRLSRPLQLLKAAIWIRNLIQTEEFDIVHGTMAYGHIISVLSTLFLNIKRVWFQHGPVGGLLDKLAVFLPVDQILFNSKFSEEQHLKMPFGSRNSSKHKIINLGITKKAIERDRLESIKNNYPSKILLVSAGRICEWKGQDIVIEALGNLFKTRPALIEKLHFLIVGDVTRESDNIYKEKLERLVQENQLTQCVDFLGHKNNIEEYYAASDLFIHSSTIPEPFGLVVAEAMMAGALVVGSSRGGIQDILIEGETGYTFDPTASNRVEQLENIIIKVLTQIERDTENKLIIREKAQSFIEQNYSIERMTQQIESSYQELN